MDLPTPTFWDTWGEAAIAVMIASVLIFAIKHASAFFSRATLKETEKRRQADAESLAEVKQRLGSIEALLRQVE